MAGRVEIEWSLDALADLDRFAAFLHERFPDLAARVANELVERTDVLRRHPKLTSHRRSRGIPRTPTPGARWHIRPSVPVRRRLHSDAPGLPRARSQVGRAPSTHAARRRPSTCRSHPSSWFQLAKMRLTSFRTHFAFRLSAEAALRQPAIDPIDCGAVPVGNEMAAPWPRCRPSNRPSRRPLT